MKFNRTKAGPLLIWMNAMFPEKPIWEFVHMRDGIRLLEIFGKLNGEDNIEVLKTLSLDEKLKIIFSYVHDEFNLTKRQSFLILQKLTQGTDVELQLAKVMLLLCYCSFKKGNLLPLDSRTELPEITSMFRFVKDGADGLSLDEGLDQFLEQDAVVNSSGGSSGSSLLYTDDESPYFGRFQRLPRVQFQELCTVASSSDSSPVPDVMSTPHFQLKRLRKELAHEGDVRDELEKELTDQINVISEKEGLIVQLQHRVDRMLREQRELEKDHKAALLELQEKNESLLRRVHEVVKQCHDLKTENSLKDKKIDELAEENQTFAAQVRNTFAQLARAEEEVTKLTLAHESSLAEWRSRKEFLEHELNEAVTHRECLSEQVQILQGKISVLEDELLKAQSQERGEVLGPIMEWEKLKQELADLTLKLAELQDTISCLEKEKTEVEALLAEERASFEKETRRLQMVVFDLEQSVNSIRLERETLEEALRCQKEMLTAQISALESDVSRLQQVEVQLTAEIKISADLRQQREELEGKVVSLDKMVHALHAEIQGLKVERASQQDALNALIVELQSTKNTVQEYEKKLEEHQKVVAENILLKKEACTLEQELDEHLQVIGDLQGQINVLRQEKTEGENQVLELSEQISLKDEEIRNLRNEYNSVDHELKLVKEQNIEINELIKSNRKEHEETVKKLQQELYSASSAASEKQEEMLVLSAEVTSLKEQICRYSEHEVQKQQEMSVLETQHNSLLNQLAEATATASHKDSELLLLQNEIHQQESLRNKAQELETAKREELERTVSELQAKILHVSTLASERDAQVISLQNGMKDQELSAKQAEDDLRRELEEKVGNLQGELDALSRCTADKDNQLGSLDQKLKEMEGLFLQKEKDVLEMHQAKEDLEKRLVDEKQQLEEYQQKWEIVIKERDHLSIEVTSLSDQICSYQDTEVQKQQEMSVLEVEYNQLKENMAALEKKLLEDTTTASQKDSELLLLQNELHQQESIREKAQELETAKCEELERAVSELQAKIQHVSTLASEREASHQNELEDQLRAKQAEDDIRTQLEEKVETLQRQLETATLDVTDKDQLLQTLYQKLNQMELLCQQKEKDVLDIHQVKEDFEKRIDELVVEKQQLEGNQQNLEMVRKEREHLSTEVTSLNDKIRSYQESEVQKQQEMSLLEAEHRTLMENLDALKTQVTELTTAASQKESELLLLQKESCEQEKLREKAQDLEKDVSDLQAKIQEVSTLTSEREAQISSLQNEMNDQQLKAKQSEDDLRTTLEEKVETLQRQLDTASCEVTDKKHILESLDQKLRQMEVLCQQKERVIIEMHQAKEELEKRIVELHADKQQLDGYQQNLEMLRQERSHLTSLNQSLQRECDASQKIRAELELKVEEKNGSILALKKTSRQWEEQNQELLEQLKTKSETVEHYKSQVEKAKNHYNGKKQLLVEAQELNKNVEQSLEASKREVKALEVELKLARMELDQANAKEKNLAAKVKNLEAQVDFADRQLREHGKMTDDIEHMRHRDSQYIRVPEKRQDTSTDSLEFELNDSLNPDRRSAVPGESSTPLVRSSDRLAAKRRALGTESLETLYFTPMGQQGNKRKADYSDAFERKLESSITSIGDLVVDSAKKLTASARRRRTTQVINITLAKKTPGSTEGEESFSSLHSARSQPNLAVHHSRPFSMDLSEESLSKADTLQNLPGYRRSAVHTIAPPRATSTFCIGEENEPEHASDDWMRIAELQARNKVCLPHLKSSYPLESRPSLGPSFTVTDDDLRMGDPDETIRRASMAPGQILETLNSRRFSLAPGASSTQGPAVSQPQRATMLPGQIRSSTAAHRSSQLTKTSSHLRASENKRSPLAPKRPGSQLQGPDTPEAKKLASCFPRPMTPKGRFGNSQNRPPNSPAERRQSVVFTVVNTPKNSSRGDSRLQRGLNKLRNSARKSPGVASRALRSAVSARSPLDSTLRKSPRNKSPKSSNAKKMRFRIKV
ncbi:hypothetical protein R3I94_006199 [Phoxinus phoxinus]